MTENEKRLRELLGRETSTVGAAVEADRLLDALLAETRQSARDAALEEAAQYHDRKGDDARAWLDEHERCAMANVVASWRTSLEVHRRSAVALRALKSQPERRYLDAEHAAEGRKP